MYHLSSSEKIGFFFIVSGVNKHRHFCALVLQERRSTLTPKDSNASEDVSDGGPQRRGVCRTDSMSIEGQGLQVKVILRSQHILLNCLWSHEAL